MLCFCVSEMQHDNISTTKHKYVEILYYFLFLNNIAHCIMINSEEHTTKTDRGNKSESKKSEHKLEYKEYKSEQKQENSKEPVINVINYTHNNENSVIINFDQEDYSFKVYSIDKTFLGTFSSKDLIKFITNKIYPNFFINIGSDLTFPLIKKYICDVLFENDVFKIKLLNYLESPFMANIEMVIKLYQGIVKINDIIRLELEKIQDVQLKSQVNKILKQLSYVILNYSLRFISQISSAIKDDMSKTELKNSLMRQSIMIVYKLNTFMRDEIDEKIGTYKLLQDDLVRIGGLKIEMYKKIEDLNKKINDQNSQLDELKTKFDVILSGTHINSDLNSSEFENISFNSSKQSQSSEQTTTDDGNSSYMFNDSDCNFTESGDAQCVNYLSPK